MVDGECWGVMRRSQRLAGPEQQRANVVVVDDAHKQRWPWFGTRSSDSTSTLYHIVAWRMALARRHLGAAEKASGAPSSRRCILGWP